MKHQKKSKTNLEKKKNGGEKPSIDSRNENPRK